MRKILGILEVFLGVFKKTKEKKDSQSVSEYGWESEPMCLTMLGANLSVRFFFGGA